MDREKFRLQPIPLTSITRTITAYHEAAHAIGAMTCHRIICEGVILEPLDRPDAYGMNYFAIPLFVDEPLQNLIYISLGKAIMSSAPFVAEWILRKRNGWKEDHVIDWYSIVNDEIDWFSFYESEYSGCVDAEFTLNEMEKSAKLFGLSSLVKCMRKDIEAAVTNVVTNGWPQIMKLAFDLEKKGEIKDLSSYRNQSSSNILNNLCRQLCIRYGRNRLIIYELANQFPKMKERRVHLSSVISQI